MVASPRVNEAPRTSATGRPAVLPSVSSAADASSSATARTVDFMTRPSASGTPRRSSSGNKPGHADRDIDDAPAPGPAERVGHDDGDVDAVARSDGRADPRRGTVGVDRQERHDRTGRRPDVRGIDAAVGAHEPVRGLGDQYAVLHPDDASGLAEDDLDLARVAVEAFGELDRLAPGSDGRQVDDGSLGLRHDLLGDDEHVVDA